MLYTDRRLLKYFDVNTNLLGFSTIGIVLYSALSKSELDEMFVYVIFRLENNYIIF